MFLDTRNFSWAECSVRVAGIELNGIHGVSWNPKQEKEPIYGKGTKPLMIKGGNEIVDGSVSLLQLELERLNDVAPQGNISKLKNVNIQIAFANDNGDIVRYSITGAEFTETAYNIAQNDKTMVVELPFIALDCVRR